MKSAILTLLVTLGYMYIPSRSVQFWDTENSIQSNKNPLEAAFQGCEHASYPPPPEDTVPVYTIDLDLPPRLRWEKLIKEKKVPLKALVFYTHGLMEDLLGKTIFSFINGSMPQLTKTLPEPYRSEIYGIASAGGFSVTDITLYNIFYEIFTFCTSIVAQDPDGKLYHARNLDFGLFLGWDKVNNTWNVSELLKPLIVQLNWIRGGKTLYQSTSYTGFVGILTAIKKDKFTFSLDERFTWNGGYIGLIEWIIFKDYRQSWVSFVTREVMEVADSYKDAVQILSERRLLAPVYFILAGTRPNEGVIITRGRDDTDQLFLNSTMGLQGSWFLVETNYDHWKTPPFYDDRRAPAIRCLSEATQERVGIELLYNVLSTKPILNKLTTLTSVMNVYEGSLGTWMRYCPDPCWPW